MSESGNSNLQNVPQCNALSKRTGMQCRQPRMKGKRVCRIHGGKSTGPKTMGGKQRIREAKLVHGQYSRNAEERRLLIREAKINRDYFKILSDSLDKQVQQARLLEPYMKAYYRVESREEFGLIGLFVFGRLNNLLRDNPTFRSMVREFFEILFDKDCTPLFEGMLGRIDKAVFQKMEDIPEDIWERLKPEEKAEEYICQFLCRVMQLRKDMLTASENQSNSQEKMSKRQIQHETKVFNQYAEQEYRQGNGFHWSVG